MYGEYLIILGFSLLLLFIVPVIPCCIPQVVSHAFTLPFSFPFCLLYSNWPKQCSILMVFLLLSSFQVILHIATRLSFLKLHFCHITFLQKTLNFIFIYLFYYRRQLKFPHRAFQVLQAGPVAVTELLSLCATLLCTWRSSWATLQVTFLLLPAGVPLLGLPRGGTRGRQEGWKGEDTCCCSSCFMSACGSCGCSSSLISLLCIATAESSLPFATLMQSHPPRAPERLQPQALLGRLVPGSLDPFL